MVSLPVAPTPFRHRLVHLADRLAGEGEVKIIAIGSSTTQGEGNIRPYPARLQDALNAAYPNRDIIVLNKGQGGEEATDELKRFQHDVLDENPVLVIWQVGTNAVFHGDDLDQAAAAIRYGLDLLNDRPMDVIVMDLQYLPAVLTPDKSDAAEHMVALIGDAVARARGPVNLFQRFAYMRAWHELERISFDRMVDPTDLSRLHHSDWSIQRIVNALSMVMSAAIAPASPNWPPLSPARAELAQAKEALRAKPARRRPKTQL
jgi:hypothetical protein